MWRCLTKMANTLNNILNYKRLPLNLHPGRMLVQTCTVLLLLASVVNEWSHFPVVEAVWSTSANTVIHVLECTFSMFGSSQTVKTDNGPPFSKFSSIFRVSPYKNCTLMATVQCCYWSIHEDAWKSCKTQDIAWQPAELTFGNKMHTKIPIVDELHVVVHQRHLMAKEKIKVQYMLTLRKVQPHLVWRTAIIPDAEIQLIVIIV